MVAFALFAAMAALAVYYTLYVDSRRMRMLRAAIPNSWVTVHCAACGTGLDINQLVGVSKTVCCGCDSVVLHSLSGHELIGMDIREVTPVERRSS